jgi:hypothetical protein
MAGDASPGARTVFTDLEASTRLWERFPEAMQAATARHDAILHAAVENAGGRVVNITGDGLMAVFASASEAGALGLAGRPTDGLDLIDEALKLNGENTITYPEFALLKGDLLLGLQDIDDAARWFRRGLEVAAAFELRMPQLRASARLTRISGTAEEQRDRAEELREIYSTFTEGFDALDLVEARAVLDEWRSRGVTGAASDLAAHDPCRSRTTR